MAPKLGQPKLLQRYTTNGGDLVVSRSLNKDRRVDSFLLWDKPAKRGGQAPTLHLLREGPGRPSRDPSCARGEFFKAGAAINLPMYLEAEVQVCLADRAKAGGIEVAQLVNELLKKNIELIEAAR